MSLNELLTPEGIILAAAVVAALGVIWRKVIRPLFKLGETIHETYKTVKGYDTRLTTVETRSEQLVNNSGSSLKDAVDRIEYKQAGQTRMLNEHVDWAQDELLKVWQNLASRDAVQAAAKTAEMMERGKNDDH